MTSSLPPQRIGELAARLGLTARTLRYWEERGLIPQASRSSCGYRLYGDEHARAAEGVDRLRAAGLSLDEIEAMSRCVAASHTALAGLSSLERAVRARITQLQQAIAAQQELLAELHGALDRLAYCNGCDGKPYDAGCIHCLDRAKNEDLPVALDSVLRAATNAPSRAEEQ